MRPSTYSKEEIIAAGNELKNSHTNITGYSLSNHLGGGRPDRLIEVWRTYVAENECDIIKHMYLPEGLEKAMDGVLDKVKVSLSTFLLENESNLEQLAEKRIEKERKILLENVKALEEKLVNADSIIYKNEDQIESLREEIRNIEYLKEKIAELEKLIIELKTKELTFNESIADKNRIIAEQEARILELKQAA